MVTIFEFQMILVIFYNMLIQKQLIRADQRINEDNYLGL